MGCSKCGRSTEGRYCVCPECGHTDWGQLAGGLVIGLVCAGLFFYLAPRISSATARSVVHWITGILGGLCLLATLFGIGEVLRHRLGKGVRIAGLVLAVVIMAAGAVLLLPALGVRFPAFLPNLVLVTVTPAEAAGRQATAPPATGGPQAATAVPPATGTLPPTPRPTATRAVPATASLPRAVVTGDTLNVRTGPGTNYPKVGVLSKGDQVVVTGRTKAGDWLAVTLAGGNKGWVSASLVQLDVPVSAVAVAQNIPKPPTPAATKKPAVPTATLTVDEQIARIAKGTHGALPQPGDMGGVPAGGEAEVTIVNDTPHVLTVLVGSPSATTITIEACPSCHHYSIVGPMSCQEEGRPKVTIRLKPGSSQVVAQVNDRSVTPFLGTWELQADTGYFNCFFIVVR